MHYEQIKFSSHALRRMFEREIGQDEAIEAIAQGDIIDDYPDDVPLPSALMPYYQQGNPLHVVVAQDAESSSCIVITAYRPDLVLWNADFKTRRS